MLDSLRSIFGGGQNGEKLLQKYFERGGKDLREKNAAHQTKWGIESCERWDLDTENGKLIFSFPDKIVTCEAQIIGSLNKFTDTWLWAWANSSVTPNLSRDCLKIKAFGEKYGIQKLIVGEWKSAEEDAWNMVILGYVLGEAKGAYRGLAGDVLLYLTFGEPRIELR